MMGWAVTNDHVLLLVSLGALVLALFLAFIFAISIAFPPDDNDRTGSGGGMIE